MIEIETERLTLEKLGIADKEHYLNKGGVGPLVKHLVKEEINYEYISCWNHRNDREAFS